MNKPQKSRRGKKQLWLIPVVLLVILSLSVGVYYAWDRFDLGRRSNPGESINTDGTTSEQDTTSENSELALMRTFLSQDTFFEGIWVDDVDLSGKTYLEAVDIFRSREMGEGRKTVAVLTRQDEEWSFSGRDCGLMTDWQIILDQAWQVGRLEADKADEDVIRKTYQTVQELKEEPAQFETTQSWDSFLISKKLKSIALDVDQAPVAASASGFDTRNRTFVIEEGIPGFSMNIDTCFSRIVEQLQSGNEAVSFPVDGSVTTIGKTAAQLKSSLTRVSEARTYANAPNPPRDENIRLICEKINGMVLQPGEVFSFNRYIGERTAARGFKPAGGIVNGVLESDIYGGGICQPNTTLYLAVAQADLEIVERYPHSWPSTYVPIGLDATVNWGGADFKFRNNTDGPIAVVAWFDKPAIVVQVYGRSLGDGVSISLTSTHDGYIPIDPPKGTYNPNLKPGQKVVKREEHIGQLATSYKVWTQNGTVIKREVLAKSRYRPIQGLFEYGPDLPPEPTATPPPPPEPTPEEPAPETPSVTPPEEPAPETPPVTSPEDPAPETPVEPEPEA